MFDISKITWLAWASPLLLLWGQFRGLVVRLATLLIRVESFPRQSYMTVEVERWLRDNGTYVSGKKFWWSDTVPCRGDQAHFGFVTVDARDPVSLYLVGKLKVPVLWNLNEQKLTYLAGTIDRKGLDRYFESHVSVIAERLSSTYRKKPEDFQFGPGFHVTEYMGTGRSNKDQGDGPTTLQEVQRMPSDPAQPAAGGVTTGSQHLEIIQQRWGASLRPWWEEEKLIKDYRHLVEAKMVVDTGDVKRDAALKDAPPYVVWGPMIELFADFRRWAHARPWFFSRKLCWRRGALLAGPPGTGKTEMVLALAHRFQMRVIRAELQTMGIRDLSTLANLVKRNDSTILLIEDIDAVFRGRENVLVSKSSIQDPASILSFEAFINFLGGASKLPGCYTIATTNNPEVLDEALVRPGRLDLHLEVGRMQRSDGELVAERYLGDYPSAKAEVLQSLKFPATTAEVMEACTTKAMELFNNKIS